MNLTRPKAVFVCENSVYNLQIAGCIEDVEATFVVFGTYLEVVSLKDILSEQTEEEIENFQPTFIDDLKTWISMIIFSSGTTGFPKGVALSYEMLFRNIVVSLLPIPKCVALCYSSIYWISGTIFLLQVLTSGATRIIHANSDPEEICKVIERYKVKKKIFILLLFIFFSTTNSN